MSFEPISQAIQQEATAATTDQTRSVRVRRGVYSMRERPGFYMVRTRIPAGLISPEQLEAIAALAEEVNWPLGVHLTTRQGLELPGVPADKVVPILEKLQAAGITTFLTGGNSLRSPISCPYAGVTADEVFDVTPYALAVDHYFREVQTSYQVMPRKIKLAFEGCAHTDHVRTQVTDIGLRAVQREGQNGFQVLIAGGLGATPKLARELEAFIPVSELLLTIETILRVFNAHGNRENRSRARLKWLLEEKGLDWFRGEYDRERADLAKNPPALQLPTLTETAPALDGYPAVTEAELGEHYAVWKETNIHEQPQPGRVSVSIRVPNGDLLPQHLRQIAALTRRFAGNVRTSIEQNFLLRHVSAQALPALYLALKEAELDACCADELIDITRCAGSDVCLSALTNSRGAAFKISEAIRGDFSRHPDLRHLRIRVSGCPNSCSHHHTADIGLFGLSRQIHGKPVPHYAIELGGTASGTAVGSRVAEVPALRVGQAVKSTLIFYRDQHTAGEDFAAFVERVGPDAIKERLAPLANVPPPETAPTLYRDLGSDKDFRLTAKRGECAA
ncbi:MAG: hypothetical protein B9S32_09385 [Verrucomicrobia bacterium Tous-C9LFEB]|nr:MAG: hypothetical protein B9S32_09385 [Verrucomicrobia bacterium Tous-C9LFEB]